MCQYPLHLEAVLLGIEMDEDPYHRPSGTRLFRFYRWGSWGFSPLWLLLHTLYPFPSVFSFIPDPGPGDRYLVIQGLLVTVGMGMLSGF